MTFRARRWTIHKGTKMTEAGITLIKRALNRMVGAETAEKYWDHERVRRSLASGDGAHYPLRRLATDAARIMCELRDANAIKP